MDKEKDLLKLFTEDLYKFDKIITYNGDSFDLPFINHKLNLYGVKSYIDKSKSFDLYRIIRANKDYLDLKNLKLKTIEESLGFFRKDIYSGFECIKFYHDYISSKDQILKKNILRHNYDDLVHMLDILSILDLIDKKKSIHVELKNTFNKLKIINIETLGDMLFINGNIESPLKKDIKYYGNNYSLITNNLIDFKLSLETKEGYITKTNKCTFIDLLNFNNIEIKGHHTYNLPKNIFILLIGKKLSIDNIKLLLKKIFENSR